MTNNKSLKNNNTNKNKKKISNLTKKINELIYRRGDICCEEDIDRDKAIVFIIKHYKGDSKGIRYLDSLANDIIMFIGIKQDLEKNNNKYGSKLWDTLDKQIYINDEPNLKNIVKIMHNLPLYYLLAFIGKFTLNVEQ
jgi:hypothetical protein